MNTITITYNRCIYHYNNHTITKQMHTRICMIRHISTYSQKLLHFMIFFLFSFPLAKITKINKINFEFYRGHRSHFNTVLNIGIPVSYVQTQAICWNQLIASFHTGWSFSIKAQTSQNTLDKTSPFLFFGSNPQEILVEAAEDFIQACPLEWGFTKLKS